jgi:hypothetical protein
MKTIRLMDDDVLLSLKQTYTGIGFLDLLVKFRLHKLKQMERHFQLETFDRLEIIDCSTVSRILLTSVCVDLSEIEK